MHSELSTQALFYNGVIAKPFVATCNLLKESQELILSIDEQGDMIFPFADLKLNHRDKNLLILGIKSKSNARIEVKDEMFIRTYLSADKNQLLSNWYSRFIHAKTYVHLFLAVAILAFCAALYFYAVPFLAEKAVDLIPRSIDDRLGATISNEPEFSEDADSLLSLELNHFLRIMAPELDSRYRIHVMHDDVINAFALPDGNIIINTGILQKMNRYEELAAVLSHEVAHVEHRHAMRLLSRNLSGYILLSLVLSDVNGILTVFIDNAHQFQAMSYSRKFEKEADLSGLQLLQAHHIDASGMIDLFKMLEKQHQINIPEWMSTHPISQERINYLSMKIKENPKPLQSHPDLKKSFASIKNAIKN